MFVAQLISKCIFGAMRAGHNHPGWRLAYITIVVFSEVYSKICIALVKYRAAKAGKQASFNVCQVGSPTGDAPDYYPFHNAPRQINLSNWSQMFAHSLTRNISFSWCFPCPLAGLQSLEEHCCHCSSEGKMFELQMFPTQRKIRGSIPDWSMNVKSIDLSCLSGQMYFSSSYPSKIH